jgi:choline dehydrogenase-like flavoprotein
MQGYLALPRATQRAEQLVDVQIRLEPVYGKRFAAALDSSDVKSARALARELKHGSVSSHLAEHIADVLDDLTTWRRVTVPGAPLPVPYPEVAARLRHASARELRALVPDALGDVAAIAMRETTGRAPLDAVSIVTRIEPVPNPSSRIALIDERDALGLRKVSLDWRLSPLDRHSVHRTLELFGAELGRAGLGRLRITFDEAGDSWPDDLAGGWHHMGTTRMHDDPRSGVVDRNGRVHSLANLFVAGSSVFPTAGSGTPTLLIVALALRMAAHLKELLS